MMPTMSHRPDRDRTPTGVRLDTDRTAVTIAEAARVLGLSTDAVRKRLQRGTLAGAKIGDGWRVFLDDAVPDADDPTRQRPDVSSPRPDVDRRAAVAPDAMVAHLRDEVAYLREQLGERSRELAAERERFDVLHREALARIPALGAGQDASDAAPAAPGGADTVKPGSAAPASWWRFWERRG